MKSLFFYRIFALFFLMSAASLALTSHSSVAANQTKDWADFALKLSGESERVTIRSIRNLKTYPHLKEHLKTALKENSTHTFLALDVISILRLEALIPDVMALAKQDDSGFFYLCLNTFFHSSHRAELVKLYGDTLADPTSTPPVKMVVLDTFGRLSISIPASELKKFLTDPNSPEVKSAALYYVRAFALRGSHEYDAELNDLKKSAPKNPSMQPFWVQLDSLLTELAQKQGGAR